MDMLGLSAAISARFRRQRSPRVWSPAMKLTGTLRHFLGLWVSTLAVGGLVSCADSAPSHTATSAGIAVPMASRTKPAAIGVAPRLWRGGSVAPAPAATAAASAKQLVARMAPAWGAPRGAAELEAFATARVDGGDVVRMRQVVDGVAVDGGELRVLVGAGGALVAASGRLVPGDIARDREGFRLTASAAVTRAIHALHGVDISAGLRERRSAAAAGDDAVAWFSGQNAEVTVDQARARKLWHRDGDALVPAWVVETYSSTDGSTDGFAHRTVISARDGRVLARRDLTVDAFQYRVWADPDGDHRPADGPTADFSPHPTGAPGVARPPFIAPSLVSVEGLNHPAGGAPDSWLPPGATETRGNNVDAYSDTVSPDGMSDGDFRASTTGAGVFDRVYDPTQNPMVSTQQQQAAITQLFYSLNWLHDDWYDAGFTELTGNAQDDNYGRGGEDGDSLDAEAQDGANAGNRNNANMSTPDDGMSPTMQVYLWSGSEERTLTVQPANRETASRGASFGPSNFELTDDLVIGVDSGESTSDGCEDLTNPEEVAGKIVLLDRGTCTGKRKALNAQNAGAIGVVIAQNQEGRTAPSLPNDNMVTGVITIPAMSIGYDDGVALRADMGANPVQLTMFRRVGIESDGSLDGGLVAHEFGHYVHHRLSICGTFQCGAMSEGWGDFIAMHMMMRDGDALDATYSLSGYAWNGDPYFGIRRAPYSTDTTKNAFTFRMISDDEELPESHPLSGGGPNSEVHNAGEIWTTILWEGYVALQRERGSASFDDVRRKMMRYVVTGLLMSPPDGTFTEVRDAILAAAQAANPADHEALAAAFARRGLGSCAESPARESEDFVDVIESFEVKGHAAAGAVALDFEVKDCDGDATLDVGETATITVPISNSGVAPLTEVSVTASTATPGLTVLTDTVELGSMAPYTSSTATFDIKLDAAAEPTAGVVELTITSPGACTDSQRIELPIRLAVDDTANASASDSFDAASSPWTPDGANGEVAWRHTTDTALDRHWHGSDLGTRSDTALVSPALVAGDGPVSIAFDHAFEFEYSDEYYDGGVIEITTDGGATWVDASTLATVPYNATIGADPGNGFGNPIAGQMAFGDRNPSYPGTDRVSLDFGTQLAGQTFQLRFRIGTDGGVGATGWEIDGFEAVGITNTPFPVQGADAEACQMDDGDLDPGIRDDAGGCCSTGGTRGSDLAAGLVVAMLVVRRRRRST